jgi:hypothetical protein
MSDLLTFSDVCVGPNEAVLQAPAGSLFRGGPLWPDFAQQVEARQCRGEEIKAVDDMPTFDPVTDIKVEEGVWCGPIVFHFGHMIADFGMRIALSASLNGDVPLVFSGYNASRPKLQEPPPYFWAMVDHFKISRKRILIIRTPTMFRKLHVFPQAERMRGPAPASDYLDLLDEMTLPSNVLDLKNFSQVYVSRAKVPQGGLAGEAYLDQVLVASGVKVIHPETLPFSEQVAYYQSARTLVFSEGSAVHALQLLGRLDADIGILVRRNKARIAQHSVVARAKSVSYLEASPELVFGLRASGHGNESKGITLLSGPAVIKAFAAMNIDIRRHWNEKDFQSRKEADLKAWATLRLANRKAHAGERAGIEATLAKLACPLSLDAILS